MINVADNHNDNKTEIIESLLKTSLVVSEYYTKQMFSNPDIPITEALAVTNYLNHTALLIKELKTS